MPSYQFTYESKHKDFESALHALLRLYRTTSKIGVYTTNATIDDDFQLTATIATHDQSKFLYALDVFSPDKLYGTIEGRSFAEKGLTIASNILIYLALCALVLACYIASLFFLGMNVLTLGMFLVLFQGFIAGLILVALGSLLYVGFAPFVEKIEETDDET